MLRKLASLLSSGVAALAIATATMSVGAPAASAAVRPAVAAHVSRSDTASVIGWARAHRTALTLGAIEISAQVIGISPQELVTALRAGQSLAQVAAAHHVSPSTLAGALIRAGDARIASLDRTGKIVATQATRLRHRLDRGVATFLTHHFE